MLIFLLCLADAIFQRAQDASDLIVRPQVSLRETTFALVPEFSEVEEGRDFEMFNDLKATIRSCFRGRNVGKRRNLKHQVRTTALVLEERQLLTTIGSDGWSILVPSADSRLIYVSSSTGNDANDGRSESSPKRTLSAAYSSIRNGQADWILLKRGDTFSSGILSWEKSGKTEAERMVVTAYGTGPRPVLHQSGLFHWGPNQPTGYVLKNLAFVDLDFQGTYSSNPTLSSNNKAILFSGRMQNILIEGTRFSNYRVAVDFQRQYGQESNEGFEIRRSTFVNNAEQGMFLSGADHVLFEENVFDFNGRANGDTVFKHNVYLTALRHAVIRGNIFARGSNFGTKLSSDVPGGFQDFVVENNLYYNNGLSLDHSAGPTDDIQTTFTHQDGFIRDNVFTEARKTFTNGMKQDLVGWLLNSQNVAWTGNILAHKSVFQGNQALTWGGHHDSITVSQNIVYNWLPSNPNALGEPSGPAAVSGWTFSDNELNLTADKYVDASRSVGTYYTSIGGSGDVVEFFTAAAQLSKGNWDADLTADGVNDYIREGFARVLTAPAISSPASGSSTNARETVSWGAVDGADGYEIWYSNLSTGQNPFLIATSAVPSFTPDSPMPVGRYRIWVRATHRLGSVSSWSAPVVLHINSAPVLNQPSSNGEDATPEFTWTELPGSVRYELWVDNVSTKTSRVVHSTSITAASFTPSSNLGFSEYRVWVRGIDASNVPTTWSNAVDYHRDNIVTTPGPISFDGQGRLGTVSWTPVDGAVRYELWANNATTGTGRAIYKTDILVPSYTHPDLLTFGQYQFWVRAIDQQGIGTPWSGIATAANTSGLISPLVPSFNRRPTFVWNEVPGASSYEIHLSVSGSTINAAGITGSQWTPSVDLGLGDLTWWVRPWGIGAIRGPWSAMGASNTTGRARLLGAGVPAGQQNGVAVFNWTEVAGAGRYVLHVEQIGVGVVILRNDLVGTSFTSSQLSAGNYRAWVRAIDSRDNSSGIWSNMLQFSVTDLETLDSGALLAGLRSDNAADIESDDRIVMPAGSFFEDDDRIVDQPSALMTEEEADLIDQVMAGLLPVVVEDWENTPANMNF